MKDKTKFELVPAQDAATEKALATHKKNIKVYADGVRRSGAQLFGYAYLAGREMNLAKELLPHGQFEKWISNTFQDLSENTTKNWRNFATAIEDKRPTVGLLNGEKLELTGKKKFNKAQEAAICKLVLEIMDGMGMVEFMRASRFLKEPTPAGGFRPNAEKLEAWLKENHPELAGKKWEELPENIKREFQKADILSGPRMSPEKAEELTQNLYASAVEQLIAIATAPWLMRLPDKYDELEQQLQTALDRVRKLKAAAKK
jgi:hypothetical protein